LLLLTAKNQTFIKSSAYVYKLLYVIVSTKDFPNLAHFKVTLPLMH
jgi:hypothetical protein